MKTKKEKYGEISHSRRFGTEQKCRDYLVNLRWDGRPTCHKCGNKHLNYFLTSRNIWKCSNCKTQFSILKNTIFESSNLSLVTWFKAIFYITTFKRGISSCQLGRLLEVEQRTAWFILHRLREVMKDEGNLILKGIVEVDEAHFGPIISEDTRLQRAKVIHDENIEKIHGLSNDRKRFIRGKPAKRGRKKGSTKEVLAQKKNAKEKLGEKIPFEQDIAVLGMVKRNGEIVLKMLGRSAKSKTRNNVYPLLKRHIHESSTVYTDEWIIYKGINIFFQGHQTVNHKKSFVNGDVHTNGIENVWKHFRKVINGTYFHMTYQHFQKYLYEHAFRWNRMNISDREKVSSFFTSIEGKRLKYKDLISLPKKPYKLTAA